MTIEEHATKQDAGWVPEDYPIGFAPVDPSDKWVPFLYGLESMSSRRSTESLDDVERDIVRHLREAINAINEYRRERGEQEL